MHSGTEQSSPGIVDVLTGDVVVSGHTHSWVIVLVPKCCVVINKLDKAISDTSCISKNDKSSLVRLAIITIIKQILHYKLSVFLWLNCTNKCDHPAPLKCEARSCQRMTTI